jgi:hypothetical protein
LEHVPGIGPIVKSVSPFQTWDHIADAVKKGDLKALETIARQQLSMVQGVVSLVPGIGTGISSAISAGLAVLEGGGPLEIAIKTAYGALPIPPGIRQVTDVVLDTVLDLAFHHASLTDVVVNVARDEVPSGFPRDVFDTLVNVVVKHKPIVQVAGGWSITSSSSTRRPAWGSTCRELSPAPSLTCRTRLLRCLRAFRVALSMSSLRSTAASTETSRPRGFTSICEARVSKCPRRTRRRRGVSRRAPAWCNRCGRRAPRSSRAVVTRVHAELLALSGDRRSPRGCPGSC